MIDHSPHAGIKEDIAHLWNTNRPLFVTAVVGLLLLAWYLYKRQQGGIPAPTDATTGSSGVPSSISNTYITENKTIVPSAPSPITPGPIIKKPDPKKGKPTGPNPWLTPPPPGENPATWDP